MYACHKKVERLFNKMAKLILKKSTSKSDALDEDSVQLLRNLFFKKGVKEKLEIGGTLPMIDGYTLARHSIDKKKNYFGWVEKKIRV